MKVEIINKNGQRLKFKSVKYALPHIEKEELKDYDIVGRVRVYDKRLHYADVPIRFSLESYKAFNMR